MVYKTRSNPSESLQRMLENCHVKVTIVYVVLHFENVIILVDFFQTKKTTKVHILEIIKKYYFLDKVEKLEPNLLFSHTFM